MSTKKQRDKASAALVEYALQVRCPRHGTAPGAHCPLTENGVCPSRASRAIKKSLR